MTKTLPRVHILATGGTIAGVQRKLHTIGYEAAGVEVSDLLAAMPYLDTIACLTAEQISNIGSQDMNDSVWLLLARRLVEMSAGPGINGAVVMHGTDTMEETAFFLDLVTDPKLVIVMVGAMRPSTAASADGPGNLHAGVTVASQSTAQGRGVLVCFNNEIHFARHLVKIDTVGIQGFASPRRGLAGIVHGDHAEWFGHASRVLGSCRFNVAGLAQLPRVEIIYAHAGMTTELIHAAVNLGAKGIVIAGVGAGNMPVPVIDALTEIAKTDVAVVRSTRLQCGTVLRNVEIDDDARRFVASGDLNAAKSRVLLQLALTRSSDPTDIQIIFDTY